MLSHSIARLCRDARRRGSTARVSSTDAGGDEADCARDRLVVTKSDLTDEASVARLESKLRELNPQAPSSARSTDEIDLPFLITWGSRMRNRS